MDKSFGCTAVLMSLCLCLMLAACGGKGTKVNSADIVYEPEAKDVAPPLTPEEITALKSSGEIDRDLPTTAMADVTKQYRYYLRQGRAIINTSLRRGEQYLPYARGVFKKSGLPQDLAYLAIVESGYRTDVTSRAGAAGAWQFMKETGAAYGLDYDAWTDDRLDIYEATEAAANYLSKLYAEFRDWPTAIAAYNAGQGKIRRAMEASGGSNFYEVRERNETLPEKLKLREETKQYVPRFLAVVKIMRNLKVLHFTPPDENAPQEIARVAASPGTDLKSFSRSLSMEWKDFCNLNKHHQQNAISSITRDTYVYVPQEKSALAREVLASGHKGDYKGWQASRLSRSLTWKGLAKRYHTTVERLRAVNPGCSLKTGELVYLPDNAATAAIAQNKIRDEYIPGRYAGARKSNLAKVHRVQAGETLFSISRRYAVSPMILMQVNGITNPSSVAIGTPLHIPGDAHGNALAQEKNSSPYQGGSNGTIGKRRREIYVVQEHDTFWNIAKRKHVSVEDLKRWNGIDERQLKRGTELVVYVKE